MKPWTEFTREDYLVMLDRQWPFWLALHEFIVLNGIKSIVEVGCGIGHLCHSVEQYVGIDINQAVLSSNETFYRRGEWFCEDWMTTDACTPPTDLFLAATTLEHCESPERFVEKMLKCQWRYAVVTIPERLRGKVKTAWSGDCRLYDLPVSRRPRQVRRVSVLVIDRTGVAKSDMWSRRALNVAS